LAVGFLATDRKVGFHGKISFLSLEGLIFFILIQRKWYNLWAPTLMSNSIQNLFKSFVYTSLTEFRTWSEATMKTKKFQLCW
jgi:hypothetical protein